MDNRMKSVDQKEFLGGQGMVHFDHILEADEMHGMTNLEEDELQVMALIIYDHEKQD